MKLGVSGITGSFSEEAALAYKAKIAREHEEVEIIYLLDMEGVLKAIEEGTIDRGIFPVVNSIGGLVDTAFLAMGTYRFKILDKLPFEVNQCLLAKPGLEKGDILQVTSHPQALAQCQNYISREFPKAQRVEWSDTASAARDLEKGLLPDFSAVLAPAKSAEVYNLNVLESRVQDNHPNITTFIIVTPL